jgi:hypothetical protein
MAPKRKTVMARLPYLLEAELPRGRTASSTHQSRHPARLLRQLLVDRHARQSYRVAGLESMPGPHYDGLTPARASCDTSMTTASCVTSLGGDYATAALIGGSGTACGRDDRQRARVVCRSARCSFAGGRANFPTADDTRNTDDITRPPFPCCHPPCIGKVSCPS